MLAPGVLLATAEGAGGGGSTGGEPLWAWIAFIAFIAVLLLVDLVGGMGHDLSSLENGWFVPVLGA